MGGRFARGFGSGLLATLAMSCLMLFATATGMSPMPSPVPVAMASLIFRGGITRPSLILMAALAHLLYGAVWGGLFAVMVSPMTVGAGVGLGIVLWLTMQVIVLPALGWGLFGLAVTPAVWVATLVLHLVYGAIYGAMLDRDAVRT